MAANTNHPNGELTKLTAGPKLDWLSACQWLEKNGEPYCIATIVADVGSVPRSCGSKMVISATSQFDTLGGGNLEHQIIESARKKISSNENGTSIETFSLAADLGQCCGGAVQVLIETMNVRLPKVTIYGAGHVSQALCSILKHLPCKLEVIDSRVEWLDELSHTGVSTQLRTAPTDTIGELDADSFVVIMTHDHGLDFALTRSALERRCFPYIGLIGSQGKKQRFEFRLKEQLSDSSLLDQLTCPIGHPDIQGKLPMQVAVSLAAELMMLFENRSSEANKLRERTKERDWKQASKTRKALQDVLTRKEQSNEYQ